MPTFHALIIHLQATQDATLPATQGHLAHAAFLALIDSVRPELAQRLHDLSGRKPFTLSPVWGLGTAKKSRHALRRGRAAMIQSKRIPTVIDDRQKQETGSCLNH